MIKTKWLIYTVLIGLMPFFIRTFIYLIDRTATLDYWINEIDFIGFGLVLHLSILNELEDKDFDDKVWRTRHIGFSVIGILFLASLLAIVTYADFKKSDDLNENTVKTMSIIFSLISFLFSYSIYNRLNKLRA